MSVGLDIVSFRPALDECRDDNDASSVGGRPLGRAAVPYLALAAAARRPAAVRGLSFRVARWSAVRPCRCMNMIANLHVVGKLGDEPSVM